MSLLELLKQRRVWAGIFAAITLTLSLFGVSLQMDVNGLTDAVIKLIEAISGLLAVVFPIWSAIKPNLKR
jgi:hypothetical protein